MNAVLAGDLRDALHVRASGLRELGGAAGVKRLKSGGRGAINMRRRRFTHVLERMHRALGNNAVAPGPTSFQVPSVRKLTRPSSTWNHSSSILVPMRRRTAPGGVVSIHWQSLRRSVRRSAGIRLPRRRRARVDFEPAGTRTGGRDGVFDMACRVSVFQFSWQVVSRWHRRMVDQPHVAVEHRGREHGRAVRGRSPVAASPHRRAKDSRCGRAATPRWRRGRRRGFPPGRSSLAAASSALRMRGASARCSAVRRVLREDIASPSASRTVGPETISTGTSRSRTIRRITASCWKSFSPKTAARSRLAGTISAPPCTRRRSVPAGSPRRGRAKAGSR